MKANILQEQSKPKRFDCGERFQQKNFFLKRCTPGVQKSSHPPIKLPTNILMTNQSQRFQITQWVHC